MSSSQSPQLDQVLFDRARTAVRKVLEDHQIYNLYLDMNQTSLRRDLLASRITHAVLDIWPSQPAQRPSRPHTRRMLVVLAHGALDAQNEVKRLSLASRWNTRYIDDVQRLNGHRDVYATPRYVEGGPLNCPPLKDWRGYLTSQAVTIWTEDDLRALHHSP